VEEQKPKEIPQNNIQKQELNKGAKKTNHKKYIIQSVILLVLFSLIYMMYSYIGSLSKGPIKHIREKQTPTNVPANQKIVPSVSSMEQSGFTEKISDSSMEPTYTIGETVNVDLFFGDRALKRGEIVLLKIDQNSLAVRRIVGLPGEKVKIMSNKLYINGRELSENYLKTNSTPPGQFLKENIEKEIPEDNYLYLNDNRESFSDSRNLGFVSILDITGIVK